MLCDIVIPVWNQLKITKDCFESLKDFTDGAYRVIVIDNGSELPTKNYLEDAGKMFPAYKLIRFNENKGFIKATNRGIEEATAEYICLLNNDTILTQGWLSEMIAVMANPAIGALNPSSNTWRQWPPDGDIHKYAKSLSVNKGAWQETSDCVGFCMLIRKNIIAEVGLLDETFGLGFLEETDLCRRLQDRGYFCGRAKAAYVFHLGGESFKVIENARSLYKNNLKLFYQKWGKSLQIAFIFEKGLHATDQAALLVTLLSACRDHNITTAFFGRTPQPGILPDHASLLPQILGESLFRTKVFFRIFFRSFKRKKDKNYDLIVMRRSLFAYSLKTVGFLVGFKVICNFHQSSAQPVWRELSKKLGTENAIPKKTRMP